MRAWAVAMCGVLVAGCPTPPPQRDGGPSLDASVVESPSALIDAGVQFCASFATARCDLRTRCQSLQPSQRANCERETREVCLRNGAVLTGKSALREPQATDCLTRLGTTNDCDLTCAPFDIGGLPGEPCVLNSCRHGLCTFSGSETCDFCKGFTTVGADCAFNTCDPAEAFCDFGGGRVCTPLRDAGAPCDTATQCRDQACGVTDAGRRCGFAEGSVCNTQDCGPDAFCDGLFITGFGTCTRKRALGEACRGADFFQCADGMTCLDGVCARVGQSDRTAGQECRTASDCASPLRCVGNGAPLRCMEPLDAGAPCEPRACATGFFCGCADPGCTARTCMRLRDVGETCDLISDLDPCFDQLTCVPAGARMLCVPRRQVGESCSNPFQCVTPALCVRGLCTPPLDAGAPCESPAECESFVCGNNQRCLSCQ
jgi:hypothetical protein